MHIQTIRSIAKGLGITAGKMPKTDLIHAIQRTEGNFDCFGTATSGYCDQGGCSWREDCLPAPPRAAVKKAAPASDEAPAAAKPKAAAKAKPAAKASGKATGKTAAGKTR